MNKNHEQNLPQQPRLRLCDCAALTDATTALPRMQPECSLPWYHNSIVHLCTYLALHACGIDAYNWNRQEDHTWYDAIARVRTAIVPGTHGPPCLVVLHTMVRTAVPVHPRVSLLHAPEQCCFVRTRVRTYVRTNNMISNTIITRNRRSTRAQPRRRNTETRGGRCQPRVSATGCQHRRQHGLLR